MINLIRHLWQPKEELRNWLQDIGIDGRKLDFYAPYVNDVDIYYFKIGDILRDTYTNLDYRAVDKIKKKSRWGEERDVFILRSLKTTDQFGLEHSPEGFGGLRYHKKYQLLFSADDWVGYLQLHQLFHPTSRVNKEESTLPSNPGVLFFYDQQGSLQYMEMTRNIRETAYYYIVNDEETLVQPIRHRFHYLCYVERKDDEERSALFYYLNRLLQPKWNLKSLEVNSSMIRERSEVDRYKQILRFSLTIEDVIHYFKRKDQMVDFHQIKKISQFIESLESQGKMDEVIEKVLELCVKQYQDAKRDQHEEDSKVTINK